MPVLPIRIQLSRRAGWRMPPGAVSCARPGRWGNPFEVGGQVLDLWDSAFACRADETKLALALWDGDPLPLPSWATWERSGDGGRVSFIPDAETAVRWHAWWLRHTPEGRAVADAARRELRTVPALACWCPLGAPCHVDNLIALLREDTP